jgi:hypothetical protein
MKNCDSNVTVQRSLQNWKQNSGIVSRWKHPRTITFFKNRQWLNAFAPTISTLSGIINSSIFVHLKHFDPIVFSFESSQITISERK